MDRPRASSASSSKKPMHRVDASDMPTRSRTRKPLTRSEIISRIRRRDTLPEMRLRTSLHAAGLRYKVDHSIEGVHADVVFTKCRVAVFVDGCFWHACPRHGSMPTSNRSYWGPKLRENRKRDLRQTVRPRRAGWEVIRIWEHDCAPIERAARRIERAVKRRTGRRSARTSVKI